MIKIERMKKVQATIEAIRRVMTEQLSEDGKMDALESSVVIAYLWDCMCQGLMKVNGLEDTQMALAGALRMIIGSYEGKSVEEVRAEIHKEGFYEAEGTLEGKQYQMDRGAEAKEMTLEEALKAAEAEAEEVRIFKG